MTGANILDELRWRGLVAQTTDEAALRRDLDTGPVTLYCGFDPTAPSLHLGSLVPLLALARFQRAGHRPIVLAGGATGLIGDPSGRSAERQLHTADTVRDYVARLRGQMARFVELGDGPYDALVLDNLDWTAPLSALDFLRDVGKHFPVNQMLARESVSARLAGAGLSFTEFSYQLLQANDFLQLYRRHGCRLQLGGNDQWGNITAGLDLIRRVEGVTSSAGSSPQRPPPVVHALTLPLVTDANGQKIGKSTGGGNVWLDPDLTSPYALYQYLLGVDDRDVGTYLRLLTFAPQDEVLALDDATATRPQAREAQRRLATEVTELAHGSAELARVQTASAALFGAGSLSELDDAILAAAVADAPSVDVPETNALYVDVLAAALRLSRSDARRAVRDGGAYLNNQRVTDDTLRLAEPDWLHGRYAVLRRGRRSVAVARRLQVNDAAGS